MNRKTLSYQENAVNEMVDGIQSKNVYKFQAPTGSGKTLMTGMLIEKILKDPYFNVSKNTFIFVAPSTGALDYQGYEKISGYLNRGWLKGFSTHHIGVAGGKTKKSQYLENIDYFTDGTVYFIGWGLFGTNSNLSKIDSEKNNIQRVIQNTKAKNTNIILIIDEAHREVMTKSDNKQAILNEMDPFRTIEISATLDDADTKVSIDDVRNEAAIKQNVVVSTGTPEIGEVDKPGEIDDLISAALKKQSEIKAAYHKRRINDNPLILIQIPDKQKISSDKNIQGSIDDYYLEEVKKSLNNHGLKEGFNYALWLSENKTTKNKDEITKLDSSFDVLVFKQAIATGWDIPRANILVRLREPKSPKFDIQTLGRILRNPRFRYYGNTLIDNAFVFTRDEKYRDKIVKEDFVKTPNEFLEVPLSKLGAKSDVSVKKAIFKKPVIKDEVIEYIYSKLIEDQKILIESLNGINGNKIVTTSTIEIDSRTYAGNNREAEIQAKTIRNKNADQYMLNLASDDTLFEIYIKYIASFEGRDINRKAMDKFISYLSTNNVFKKKDIYKKLITTEIKNQRIKEFKMINIFEYIERLKNEAHMKFSQVEYEDYTLPPEFSYSTKTIIKEKWDNISTYEVSFNDKWDSTIENDFYSELKSRLSTFLNIANYEDDEPKIHLFRNGTSEKSFYIEYYDEYAKALKFYPDFILINDIEKTIEVLETKGRIATGQNIDKNSKAKFRSAWDQEDNLKGTYDIKFYRVERATTHREFNLFSKNNEVVSLDQFMMTKYNLIRK